MRRRLIPADLYHLLLTSSWPRLLGLLAARQTPDEILRAYPHLEAADIDEALRYAASLAEDETIELVG